MGILLTAHLAGLAVLVFAAGIFSALETALIALSRPRLLTLLDKYPRRAAGVRMWLENPNLIINVLVIGFNLAAVFASTIASDLAARIATARGLPLGWTLTAMAGAVGIALIVCGDLVPKMFAIHHAARVVLWTMAPMMVIVRALMPVTRFATRLLTRLPGLRGAGGIRRVTEEDVLEVVAAGELEGAIDRHQRQMIHSVLEFGDITVAEVMTPREMIEGVDLQGPRETLIDRIVETGHTRVPVYDGTLNHLRGIVYAKDLLIALRDRDVIVMEDLIRPAYLVPADTRVNELLREFKTRRTHIALVTALGGRLVGLVAMHDLLEEIVGEILEEYVLEESERHPATGSAAPATAGRPATAGGGR